MEEDKIAKRAKKNPSPRLKHDRRVYRLWFEFLKRAYEAEDVTVDEASYADWGDVVNTPFKEWWEDHWVDLFAEQDSLPRVITDQSFSSPTSNASLLIEIPINKPITTVLEEVKEVIKPHFDHVRAGRKKAFPSTAKFQITPGAEVRIETFRMILRCYHLKQGGNRTKDIPEGIRRRIQALQGRQRADGRALAREGVFAGDAWENLNRYVQRYVKQARTIIRNVALGEFPGKY